MKQSVHVLAEGDSVRTAARLMRERNVGFLPVCDSNGKVVGILTDRDIALRVCGEDCIPSKTLVGSVMTKAVISCRPDDLLLDAHALMRQHRITRIVIVDEGSAPTGILSLSDLAQYEPSARIGRTVRSVAERKYGPERP